MGLALLGFLHGAAGAAAAAVEAAPPRELLNVLMIAVDDLRAELGGAYGSTVRAWVVQQRSAVSS
jgi:hypothetical protein